jgi:hypothetical protein
MVSFPSRSSRRYTQVRALFVILAGKRVSSAMDGELKYIHVVWIPAIPAGMTGFNKHVYNDESSCLGAREHHEEHQFTQGAI